jgi:hypothetical protein
MEIEVAIDTTITPPVIVIPKHPHAKKGNDTIHWKPIGDTPFTFVSLTPTDNPNPFSNIVLSNNNLLITAQYNNQDSKEYAYTIVVLSGGVQHSSESIGNGGGPTIRNN